MPVWDRFITEDDRKVVAGRTPRISNGLGRSAAVLIADMQIAACRLPETHDKGPNAYAPRALQAIAAQKTVLAAARQRGLPIIFSKRLFRSNGVGPRPGNDNLYLADAASSTILPELEMTQSDILIEKQGQSCFGFTNLPLILAQRRIDTLLVCGSSTSGVVRATCVDARGYELRMCVIEEAVFDAFEFSHAAALFDMSFKICDVISCRDAVARIRAHSAVDAEAPLRQY